MQSQPNADRRDEMQAVIEWRDVSTGTAGTLAERARGGDVAAFDLKTGREVKRCIYIEGFVVVVLWGWFV